MKSLHDLLFKKIDATGLAIFRICYCLVLFCEIGHLYRFRSLNGFELPFSEHSAFDATLIYPFWMVVVFLLLLGVGSFWLKLINYVCSVLVFSSLHAFEYHIFYTYVGVNFIFLFTPVSKVLSLDSLLDRVKFLRISIPEPDRKVSVFYYFIPVFIGMGLIYFDSLLYKLDSPMWLNGLGMWLPANVPFTTWTHPTFVSNMEWLVKGMNYVTIVFEGVFIYLFWFRLFRMPLFILGVGLHIGILIEFPIPWFALCFLSIYVLMIPVGFWKFFKVRNPALTIIFDSSSRKVVRLTAFISALDVFGNLRFLDYYNRENEWPRELKIGAVSSVGIVGVAQNKQIASNHKLLVCILKSLIWTYPLLAIANLIFWLLKKILFKDMRENQYFVDTRSGSQPMYMQVIQQDATNVFSTLNLYRKRFELTVCISTLVVFTCTQLLISLSSPYARVLAKSSGVQTTMPYKMAIGWSIDLFKYYNKLLGVGHHDVFVDSHFKGYDHAFKISYISKDGKEITLPLISDEAMPIGYITGTLWANYTFRTNSPDFDWTIYKVSSLRYIQYWLKEEKMPAANQKFRVYFTRIRLPKDWEKDYFENVVKQIKWKHAASIDFSENGKENYTILIPDIKNF